MPEEQISRDNSLEGFRNLIPGNHRRVEDVAPSLEAHGDLKKLVGIDAIINSIRNILLTSKETYVFDPEYGLGLHQFIFEPFDDRTKEKIKTEVKKAVRRYEGRAKIGVIVRPLTNRKGFRLDLNVKFRGDNRRLSLTFDETLLRDA